MKTPFLPLALATAAGALLAVPASADPAPVATAPIVTTTDKPVPAPVDGAKGQTNTAQPNAASPTGATKNMAPIRGEPKKSELKDMPKTDSASGLTVPGATSGSSLGTGSNSTITPAKKVDPAKP